MNNLMNMKGTDERYISAMWNRCVIWNGREGKVGSRQLMWKGNGKDT